MKNDKMIKKVNMICPVCGKEHEVEVKEHLASITIKGERVEYLERYYYCCNANEDENEFATGEMVNENLLNARNAYRVKMGLLTSWEIVAIRENYGLSQIDLARLLGWGEATISRYESKAIQDDAYDSMLRLIRENPLQVLFLLKKNAEKFTIAKEKEIRTKVLNQMDSYGKEYASRQKLLAEYAAFQEPSDENGFALIDIDKIEAMISYIAEKVCNLFKVKLMKILWYSDALSFCDYGHAITGLVYSHEPLGALPIGHNSIMNLERVNVQEEISSNLETMYHIYPMANIDYSVLSDEEKIILNEVITQFKDYKTKDIVEYMHNEKAYKETEPGSVIPFSLAESINRF